MLGTDIIEPEPMLNPPAFKAAKATARKLNPGLVNGNVTRGLKAGPPGKARAQGRSASEKRDPAVEKREAQLALESEVWISF